MAGSISLSMTQQLDEFGKPLIGGQLFFIQAGTVATPQNAFQDSALTLPWPNPMILDASGRIKQLFFADGSIKIRLLDRNGVEKLVADGVLVIGASSGGGGGSPVDPTTVLQTGALMPFYGTGVRSGFVRCNARTIGSATSGATERGNADTQALFGYLWDADPNLAVSTGRGISSAADWTANKNITLPDWRGRALAFMDDMGNSAAGRLTATYFGTAATVLGAAGGAESQTLITAQLPSHNHPVFAGTETHTHSYSTANFIAGTWNPGGGSSAGTTGAAGATTGASATGLTVRDTAGGAGTANQTATTGSGAPHPIVPPTLLATIYLKM